MIIGVTEKDEYKMPVGFLENYDLYPGDKIVFKTNGDNGSVVAIHQE